MDDAVQTLTAWLSPAFPVGAFAYSHGLEWAVAAGDVGDRAALVDWVGGVLRHGAGRTDAILLAAAYRATAAGDAAALAEITELGFALQPSAERRLESAAQGAAFAETAAAAWPAPGLSADPAPYPVAVGRAAAAHGLPLELTAALYIQAVAANLVSAGVRLIPIGQTDGQRATAAFLPVARAVAEEALAAAPDDLGGATFRADIASMRHETQHTRLFRS